MRPKGQPTPLTLSSERRAVLEAASSGLRDGDRVLDIGPGVEERALFMASARGARVHAVAADAAAASRLRQKVSLRQLSDRVTVDETPLRSPGRAVDARLVEGPLRLLVVGDALRAPGIVAGAARTLREQRPVVLVARPPVEAISPLVGAFVAQGYLPRETFPGALVFEPAPSPQPALAARLQRAAELVAHPGDPAGDVARRLDRLEGYLEEQAVHARRAEADMAGIRARLDREPRPPPPAAKARRRTRLRAALPALPVLDPEALRRKTRKLARDPEAFLADARSPALRALHARLYGRTR